MNKVFLIGRLVDNPEHRTTQTGASVTTFRIGVNRRFNREQSDFFTIVAWRGLADNCAKYLVKGQQVAVTGEIQTRSYDDRNGVRRTATEIQADDIEFLARPMSEDQKQNREEKVNTERLDDIGEVIDDDDDDLPF